MENLVSYGIIVHRVYIHTDSHTIGSLELYNLCTDRKCILMQGRIGLPHHADSISIGSKGRPSTYNIESCLVELCCTTLTSLQDEYTILHIQVSCTQVIQSILNLLQ